MSQTDEKIELLSAMLKDFVEAQAKANTVLEARIFSSQTLLSGRFDAQSELVLGKLEELDKKIEDVRYYLESITAQNTNTLFEENEELRALVGENNNELANLKSNLYDLGLKINALQKV